MFDQATLFIAGFLLIFIGFIIVFLAILLSFLRAVNLRNKVKGGALIMIGPIPIVFGTDKETVKILLVLSIILIALAIILALLPQILK